MAHASNGEEEGEVVFDPPESAPPVPAPLNVTNHSNGSSYFFDAVTEASQEQADESPDAERRRQVMVGEGDLYFFDAKMEKDSDDGSRHHHTPRNNIDFLLDGPEDGQIDFLKDLPTHQTWGRRIAMFMASRFEWYNPYLLTRTQPGEAPPPSLAKAWAYFEHVTLERYVVPDDYVPTSQVELTLWQRFLKNYARGERRMEIAEPGERDHLTKLYNPLTTPLSQLGDFGLGYGIYFSTLRQFGILCFLAGLLNIPLQRYYSSEEYGGPGREELGVFLEGSAICTNRSWVPCPDCPLEYEYPGGSFSKHRETTVFEIVYAESGDWVNISSYLNFTGVNDKYYDSTLYAGEESVFSPEAMLILEEDLGVYVNGTAVVVDGYHTLPCTGEGLCMWNHCQCQIESFTDCYCQFGPTNFTDLTITAYGFAEKNHCEGATRKNGFFNLATVLLFFVGAVFIQNKQNDLVVQFDEDEQTAQDYSICVMNPPPDAPDPAEWKLFFENTFDCHVTVCTVDVDNDKLIKLLVKRREILQRLELLLPGIELTNKNLDREAARDKITAGCFGSATVFKLVEEMKNINMQVQEYVQESDVLPSCSVFVTFETESAQRAVLEGLAVGTQAAQKNDTSKVKDPRYLFRGKYVLEVIEPEEPSAIRWQEVNATRSEIATALFLTTFLCIVLIGIAFAVILFLYPISPALAPLVTTGFTSVFPMFAKALMDMEHHRSESSRQKWLFIKIAAFNILVTAVLISVVNPFTATLDKKEESLPGLISGIHALFVAQLGITPALQLVDIAGNLNRHIFAPRAKTQGDMNRQFTGSVVFLAERYANLMKYLFLIVWYCAIYPAAFFMGSFALWIVYFADRFSLMRSWARTPQLGTQISDFARNYFTPTALALMAVLSAYSWSGFPYDNLCIDEGASLDPGYIGNWTINIPGLEESLFGIALFKEPDIEVNTTVLEGSPVYKYCLQDFRAYFGRRSFPPLPKFQDEPWMTPAQEDLLNVYGWIAVGILGCVLVSFVSRNIRNLIQSIVGWHSAQGEDQGTNFSQVKSIDTYLPSYQPQMGYPLLLTDVSKIDPALFSWTDPDKPHLDYDITRDLRDIVSGPEEVQKTNLFSKVQHWPVEDNKTQW
eukprot:Nitzschia sp. Nitz4//scaffold351_size16537//12557//15992//NITZ4_008854-RA/size16537-augustus-gene-0.2-mRNA-1//1//CDS//3329548890//5684//frame0